MTKKGTYGKPQTPKSRLAAQRNWALHQLGGMQSAAYFLMHNNWIHPDCWKIIQRQCMRAKSNINTAWRHKRAKLDKPLIVDETQS